MIYLMCLNNRTFALISFMVALISTQMSYAGDPPPRTPTLAETFNALYTTAYNAYTSTSEAYKEGGFQEVASRARAHAEETLKREAQKLLLEQTKKIGMKEGASVAAQAMGFGPLIPLMNYVSQPASKFLNSLSGQLCGNESGTSLENEKTSPSQDNAFLAWMNYFMKLDPTSPPPFDVNAMLKSCVSGAATGWLQPTVSLGYLGLKALSPTIMQEIKNKIWEKMGFGAAEEDAKEGKWMEGPLSLLNAYDFCLALTTASGWGIFSAVGAVASKGPIGAAGSAVRNAMGSAQMKGAFYGATLFGLHEAASSVESNQFPIEAMHANLRNAYLGAWSLFEEGQKYFTATPTNSKLQKSSGEKKSSGENRSQRAILKKSTLALLDTFEKTSEQEKRSKIIKTIKDHLIKLNVKINDINYIVNALNHYPKTPQDKDYFIDKVHSILRIS